MTADDVRLDDVRAALKGSMDELDADVAPVLAALAEMVLRGAEAHPRIAPYYLKVGFGAYVEASRLAAAPLAGDTPKAVEVLLSLAKGALDRCVADLDRPRPDADAERPSGLIGARPSAGPRFSGDDAERHREALRDALYERALPLAEAVTAEMAGVAASSGPNPADSSSAPGVPGPYDDVREPWLRRVLRRGRRRE